MELSMPLWYNPLKQIEIDRGSYSMKLLIYSTGVIGCLYASLFSKAGYDTTLYAR